MLTLTQMTGVLAVARLRGRFRIACRAENASNRGFADLRLVLSAEVRFGVTTKMGRTTCNSAIAVEQVVSLLISATSSMIPGRLP
jgi:hypothetical protein